MSSWGIMPGSGCWVVNGYAATCAAEPVSCPKSPRSDAVTYT